MVFEKTEFLRFEWRYNCYWPVLLASRDNFVAKKIELIIRVGYNLISVECDICVKLTLTGFCSLTKLVKYFFGVRIDQTYSQDLPITHHVY